MNTRYPEIEVKGTCRQMGQQLGESTRDQIRGYAAINLDRINKTIPNK